MKLIYRSGFVFECSVFFFLLPALTVAQTPSYPPTVFTQQPQGGSIELSGNTKVLLCTANGSPIPVYRWIRNDVSLSQNSTNMGLQIRNIQVTDAGVYRCVASNDFGALLSSQAVVSVAYMVPYNTSGSNVVVLVKEGRAAIITLPKLDSVPDPTVKWMDGAYVITAETQRYHVTLDNRLVILEARSASDNNRTLKAVATNVFVQQSTESSTYVLNVQSDGSSSAEILPEFVLPPNSTTAVQGDDQARLECIANARPINNLSINWLRKSNGGAWEVVQPDSIKYQLSQYRRILTIYNPSTLDTGSYQCRASFYRPGSPDLVSAIVSEANLTVYVKPSFVTTPPSEIGLDMGLSVVMNCQALGVPPPAIRWHRNGKPAYNTTDGRYQVLNNGSLRLTNATASDSGVFQCFVVNDAGELSAATWLAVGTSEPEITMPPRNTSVIAGDSARFTCEASGAPKPSIVWSKISSGVQSNLQTGSRVQVLNGELLIPVTDVDDEGIYVCNATNAFGQSSAEAFLAVTVRTQIVRPPQNLSVIKSTTAAFKCSVSKDPSVSITWRWFLDNTELPTDPRQNITADGGLELRNVRNTDTGLYTCIVTSSGGNDTASAYLRVIELPYPPEIRSAQLSPGSNRSVDITWVPGFDGLSPVTKFILRYRIVTQPVSNIWQIYSNSIAPDQQSLTVTDLKPAKSYQFTISALNGVGESPPSNPSSVVALPQQPPSGPPRHFTGSPRSNSSILLQWQSPDPDLMNGDLLGYIVRYKLSGYPDTTLFFENITTRQESIAYELTGLIVFQEYEVSVAAYNAKGAGVYGGSLFIRTFEGVPSMPPTGLVVIAVNSTTFNLSWFPPNPQFINGINQGYKVFADEINGTASSRVTSVVLSNTFNMLGLQTAYLTNLRKFIAYAVSVLCYTSQGDGPLSNAVTTRTLQDIPDMISNLTFTNIMDTSLMVVWSPPINPNGILTNYTVTYMRKDFNDSKVTIPLSATVLNYTITGLTAKTAYTIAVWASTSIGSGAPWSADISSGITPVFPFAPTSLFVSDIIDRTVILHFVPGFSGYTSISRWIVEGQMTDDTLLNSWTVVFSVNDPGATVLTVSGLRPFTRYRLRMIAENIAGRSNASEATSWFDTLQAVPSVAPNDVALRIVNETSILVRWTVLSNAMWNGYGRGYVVQWRLSSNVIFGYSHNITDENSNSYQLDGLHRWTRYDVRVAAFNVIGTSAFSSVVSTQTPESVPSSGPVNVTAVTVTSTVIQVSWGNVSQEDQNGLILGYRIVYRLSSGDVHPYFKIVNDSSTSSVNVTELKKFSWYSVQVLAFTGVGDGALSQPAVLAMTFEDVPGPPASVYFPDVTETSARIAWSPPREPNGNLTGYRVVYGIQSDPQTFPFFVDNLGIYDRSYFAADLTRRSFYVFAVTARTVLGWGEPARLLLYTVATRYLLVAPSRPFVSQVGDRWIVLNWTSAYDQYSLVRNYSVEVQPKGGVFTAVDAYVGAGDTGLRAAGLKPNTRYQFRMAAWNDVGMSNFSESSDEVETKNSPPEGVPAQISIVTLTATSMQVSWQPPPETTWNGVLLGYDIAYRESDSDKPWQVLTIDDPKRSSAVVGNVNLFAVYEVKVRTFNDAGYSSYSPIATIYLEIEPSGPVLNVQVLNVTSSSVLVAWDPPVRSQWNGNILGYKIFHWVSSDPAANGSSKPVIIQAPDTQFRLSGLMPYTNYTFTLLSFNAAGDSPNLTSPVDVATIEDIPSPPGALRFVVPTLTSLNVSWSTPPFPNGIISNYEISYYQDYQLDGISKSVQVLLSSNKTDYFIQQLIEEMKYVFSVRCRTSVGWGQPSVSSVIIGPQPGSPEPPSKPVCVVGDTSIVLTWTYGKPGSFPLTACLLQAQEKSDSAWETKLSPDSPVTTASLSFVAVKPNTGYRFRVIGVNAVGVGRPGEASDVVQSSDVSDKPFYRQWWFLVIVALIGAIAIILVISCLCITGQRYRSRRQTVEKPQNGFSPPTLQMSRVRPGSGEVTDNDDFSVFEVRRPAAGGPRSSQRTLPGSSSNNLTNLSSRSSRHLPHPPRPSPGRVNYSEDRKSSPDSSSLSEKTSDVSTVRSQGSDSDDDVDKNSPPMPAFPSHYVSGTVKNSLTRQNTYNPYSFADNEHDGSHYGAMSLNGGHVLINNVAGSRAPLPGFSSFV